MNQKSIEIKIKDQVITLKTSDSSQLAEQVRNLVQTRLAEIENRSRPGVSPVYIATLALVEMIEEQILTHTLTQGVGATSQAHFDNTFIQENENDESSHIDFTGQLPYNTSAAV